MANSWWLMRTTWKERREIDEWWAKRLAANPGPIVWAPKKKKRYRKKKTEDK